MERSPRSVTWGVLGSLAAGTVGYLLGVSRAASPPAPDYTKYLVVTYGDLQPPGPRSQEFIRIAHGPAWTTENYATFDEDDPRVRQIVAEWRRRNEPRGKAFEGIDRVSHSSYVDPTLGDPRSQDFVVYFSAMPQPAPEAAAPPAPSESTPPSGS